MLLLSLLSAGKTSTGAGARAAQPALWHPGEGQRCSVCQQLRKEPSACMQGETGLRKTGAKSVKLTKLIYLILLITVTVRKLKHL